MQFSTNKENVPLFFLRYLCFIALACTFIYFGNNCVSAYSVNTNENCLLKLTTSGKVQSKKSNYIYIGFLTLSRPVCKMFPFFRRQKEELVLNVNLSGFRL